MKRENLLLFAIFALALVLRCLNIQGRNIQYDDAFSFFLASKSLANIVQGTAADTMPPLYYFLLHFWMILSKELWYLRMLSVVMNLATIGFLYMTINILANKTAALATAFIAAISPLQIYHAQDIRMYALLEFTQAGYVYFFVRIWKKFLRTRIQWWDWAGLVVFGTCAMYTHNLAVFVLVVPVLFLVLKGNWRLLSYVILAQFVIGVLSISWIWMIPGQVTKIQQAFWTPRPGITEVFQAIIMFSATLPLPGIWLIIGAIVSIQLIVVIIYEAIRGKLLFQANGQLILSFFLIPPILLFIVSYVMRPVFVPRGFIFSSLAYAGLAGILIAMHWPRGAASVIGIGFITAACISLPYQILFAQFPRSPFRETVTFLQNQIGTGSIVLHDNKLSYLPALFYSSTLPQKFLADEPGSPNDTFALATQNAMGIYPARNISEATDQFTKVYFVVFSETIQEYSGKDQKQNHPQLTWLELNYRRGAHWNFNDLEVFEFTR